jgi:hypothetical protein
MDIHSLPPYHGLSDSRRAWGEPDDSGKTPALRLRDYVILSIMIALCLSILSGRLVDALVYHQRVLDWDAARRGQMQQEWGE